MNKLFIVLCLFLFFVPINAVYATIVPMFIPMGSGDDCDTDCRVKFKICDMKQDVAQKEFCYKEIKRHTDIQNRNDTIYLLMFALGFVAFLALD